VAGTPEADVHDRVTQPDEPAAPIGLGERALEVALRELAAAVREEPPGSNDGPRVREYLAPTGLRGVPWCAAFASWCDREAAGVSGPLGYQASVAGLWRAAVAKGMAHTSLSEPERGDLVIFGRSGGDPRRGGTGHVGRVESWDATTVTSIDGNAAGDRVARVTRSRSEVLGWVSYWGGASALDGETAARLLALADALERGDADGIAAIDAVVAGNS
jgi:hypothetical protein